MYCCLAQHYKFDQFSIIKTHCDKNWSENIAWQEKKLYLETRETKFNFYKEPGYGYGTHYIIAGR